MENFDFTQFITINSDLPYDKIKNLIAYLFEKAGFSIISYDSMESVKRDYFSGYWNKYSFELKKDDFLGDFMDWKDINFAPEPIIQFKNIVDKLQTYDISGLRLIICSSAERLKTSNEVVNVNSCKLLEELFKMSIYSFKCPDNLIISITN